MSRIYIDVREPHEFAAGHVAGAINIPLGDFISLPDVVKVLPKDTELVMYCRSGNRSGVATQVLKQHGYTYVVNGINQATIESNS